MAPKVMLLVGAPPPSSVTASSCTLSRFQPVFRAFLGDEADISTSQDVQDQPPSSRAHAVWRSLPLVHQPLRMGGFSQQHQFDDTAADHSDDFFTTARAGHACDDDASRQVLSQFYEQSLALHNPAEPSSPAAAQGSAAADTSIVTTSWCSSSAGTPAPVGPACHLSDLEDVPTAEQVVRLRPQTVTVNLIVAVVSVAAPRTVTTRWGTQLSLVELLVGDETKAGFGVTCWLSRDAVLESQLATLHRRDTVLLRNVALGVFRGKVYGQSLRKGLTQMTLLWSAHGGGYYSSRDLGRVRDGAHPQVVKTARVREWALDFVGSDVTRSVRKTRKSWDQPPDHTQ